MLGWWFTSGGAVAKQAQHDISAQALAHKLIGAQVASAQNPHNFVALVHYDSGISRPLKQQELLQVVC